jgi:acetate kinase
MTMSLLTINSGSSSLKFGLFDADSCETTATGMIDWAGGTGQARLALHMPSGAPILQTIEVSCHRSAVVHAVRTLADARLVSMSPVSISAVGHRIVHGGTEFSASVRIDHSMKAAIARLGLLAPLHNPPALDAIEAMEAALPDVPQVAVFDTAFFAGMPPHAYVYPVPYEWYTDWGIRRFGFHGISHAYCASRAAELLGGDSANLRLVICHLGNGCSVTAVRGGTAIATTMGFTPMEGLMMGSRSGSIDPGILLHVQREHGLTVEELDHALNRESGLLGVSGVSSDFRAVEAAALQGHPRAQLALQLYANRVRASIGAMAVGLGGVDALVFTAGVGENSANLRSVVADGLRCLGLCLDAERNTEVRPDGDIATSDSPGRILVIGTREEVMIARETRRLIREA